MRSPLAIPTVTNANEMKAIIIRATIELAEGQEHQCEVADVQVEDKDDQDQIHAVFMQDNMTGMIVGTMRMVISTDQIVMKDEVTEAVNKIDMVAEALDATIVAITTMVAEAIVIKATTIMTKYRTNNRAIIMINIGRS